MEESTKDSAASSARLTAALDRYERLAAHVGGCSDGGCVVVRPVGMHTNGGCKCGTDKYKAMRMMSAGQALADEIRAVTGNVKPQ